MSAGTVLTDDEITAPTRMNILEIMAAYVAPHCPSAPYAQILQQPYMVHIDSAHDRKYRVY